ncbi:MAG: iron ABC transporter permease [Caloramator sp.]|nr:iron ABC transporter permease [Caloramator sp.]
MNFKGGYKALFIFSIVGYFIAFIIALIVGTTYIPPIEIIKTILGRYLNNIKDSSTNALIIFDIRLPRIFLASLVGAILAFVGSIYQSLFKNPMADPFILGTSSGAALGASIAIVIGINELIFGLSGVALFAFFGAILSTLIVYRIGSIGNKILNVNLLLTGVAVSFLLSSVISFIMFLNRNQVERIVFWTLGSVAAAKWEDVLFLTFILGIIFVIIFIRYKELNLISVGEDTAKSLGVDVQRVKKTMLILTSLLVACAVSVSGIIGFVGLVMPHIVRFFVGPDMKKCIPFNLIWGATFMVICDALARTILSPAEIPIGVITSLFGGPYFIHLLIKQKRKVLW